MYGLKNQEVSIILLFDFNWQRAENPWRLGGNEQENATEADKAHNCLIRTMRGMLNKITTQKFRVILEKVGTTVQLMELPPSGDT